MGGQSFVWGAEKTASSFLLRKVFLSWRMELPLVLLYQLPLLSWFARWGGFLFNHTLDCPFHGIENVAWDFRDDIHHCVSNIVTGFVNFMVPDLFMPSLLFHLIDSAVPADSYASMPFQVEGTDFMEESEEIEDPMKWFQYLVSQNHLRCTQGQPCSKI